MLHKVPFNITYLGNTENNKKLHYLILEGLGLNFHLKKFTFEVQYPSTISAFSEPKAVVGHFNIGNINHPDVGIH